MPHDASTAGMPRHRHRARPDVGNGAGVGVMGSTIDRAELLCGLMCKACIHDPRKSGELWSAHTYPCSDCCYGAGSFPKWATDNTTTEAVMMRLVRAIATAACPVHHEALKMGGGL